MSGVEVPTHGLGRTQMYAPREKRNREFLSPVSTQREHENQQPFQCSKMFQELYIYPPYS